MNSINASFLILFLEYVIKMNYYDKECLDNIHILLLIQFIFYYALIIEVCKSFDHFCDT